eukprot:CAMPEP_0114539074 /NCGR_PEP_ID=MMETSP0114-20121206/45_1 /TAXON_ID=31324 /ORGANISM="Goniomonas sp, Strain m" /LENGTH=339 /DNA_ID=CAMNT_0001723155 /DNA_START=72 /DNA_END=1091 /DNA_ORIENTATION=-
MHTMLLLAVDGSIQESAEGEIGIQTMQRRGYNFRRLSLGEDPILMAFWGDREVNETATKILQKYVIPPAGQHKIEEVVHDEAMLFRMNSDLTKKDLENFLETAPAVGDQEAISSALIVRRDNTVEPIMQHWSELHNFLERKFCIRRLNEASHQQQPALMAYWESGTEPHPIANELVLKCCQEKSLVKANEVTLFRYHGDFTTDDLAALRSTWPDNGASEASHFTAVLIPATAPAAEIDLPHSTVAEFHRRGFLFQRLVPTEKDTDPILMMHWQHTNGLLNATATQLLRRATGNQVQVRGEAVILRLHSSFNTEELSRLLGTSSSSTDTSVPAPRALHVM